MDESLSVRWILLFCLLLASAFFSGSEVALFSLSRLQLDRLREAKGGLGRRVDKLLSNPQKLLVTLYIGNELVNVAISAVTTFLALEIFGDAGIAVALGAGTFLLLIFGEVTPKTFAHYRNESWALAAAYPLTAFMMFIYPFQAVVTWVADKITHMLGGPPVTEVGVFGEEELKTLIDEGAGEGVIDEGEKEMIHGVFELGDVSVSEVMTPRTEIMALSVDLSLKDAWARMADAPYARAPVYRENLDNVEGVLFKKDLLKLDYPPDPKITLKSIIREPFIVPETMTINELLREFKRRKTHMAIAKDEYGGTQGLVTLEDVIVELVGEGGNGKEDRRDVIKAGAGAYRISASMELDDFNERFGASFSHSDIETIGGYVFHLFGRVPEPGEAVDANGFRFTVEGVKGHRIMELKLETGLTEGGGGA